MRNGLEAAFSLRLCRAIAFVRVSSLKTKEGSGSWLALPLLLYGDGGGGSFPLYSTLPICLGRSESSYERDEIRA